MSTLHDKLVTKLEKVAKIIDDEKHLYFFGLVHHDRLPPNRWDVLISARDLEPWSIKAIDYVGGLLKKELTNQEFIQIAQVVPLPRSNELIAGLAGNGDVSAGVVRGLHPMDHPDRALVIWSAKDASRQPARV